ncbi:MAG: hypothetical protein V4692_08615 [Bdellovibrionota bacterium]
MKALLALSLVFAANSAFAFGMKDVRAIQPQLDLLKAVGAECQERAQEGSANDSILKTDLICKSLATGKEVKVAVITSEVMNAGSRCASTRALSLEVVVSKSTRR